MSTASQISSPAAAFESVASFLAEYPRFNSAPLEWTVSHTGFVQVYVRYLHPDSESLIADLAVALHSQASVMHLTGRELERPLRVLHVDADFAGVRWAVSGWIPEDSFTVFALTHNPDPQEWPASERAEYAAFAASQIGAAA